jgi:hypothetical protein
MSSTPTPRTNDHDELRRQWRDHADAVFDRLFPTDAPLPAARFAQLEQRAQQLAQDLAVWLLERRAAADPQVRPAEPPPCPRCGQPGQRVTERDEDLPKRVLTTGVGDVELAREKWRCTACRLIFFPPG